MATLAGERGLPGGELQLLGYESVEWRTSLLGCPGSLDSSAGETYSAVAVPGWRVFISHGRDTYEYHADRAGDRIVTCDEHSPPGPRIVNVTREARLEATERVEIARFDPAVDAYRPVGIVEDPEEIAGFVDLLDLDMPLESRADCKPIVRIDYAVGGRTETFWFWCGGDVHVLQGDQALWDGLRGIVPEEFADLVGPYAASVPLPGLPTK